MAAAMIAANALGWHIVLQYNDPRCKSADAYVTDTSELWEIKTVSTPTMSAIDSAIKNAKGQSHNVILHIRCNIDTATAICTVRHRMRRSRRVDRVLMICDDGILADIRL